MAVISRAFLEIGANTTPLQEGLQRAIDIAKKNGAELSSAGKSMVVNFENALNPTKQLATQIEALEKAGKSAGEIQAVLGDKIKYAAEQATKNSQAVDPLVKKHYEAVTSGDKFKFSVEDLGKSLTNFATNPLQAVQSGIGGMLEKMGPTAVGIGGIAVAAGVGAAGLVKFALSAADNAERLKNLSIQTGISREKLGALEQIQSELNISGLDLGRTISTINAQLGEGKGDFIDALNKMGISMTDIATGQPKEAITLIDELGIGLNKIPEGADRAQRQADVFTGRLKDLGVVSVVTNGHLGEMVDGMIKTGTVAGEGTYEALDKLDAKVDALSRVAKAFKTQLTENVSGLIEFASKTAQASGKVDAFLSFIAFATGGSAGLKTYRALIDDTTKATNALADANAKNNKALEYHVQQTKQASDGTVEYTFDVEQLAMTEKWAAEDTQKRIEANKKLKATHDELMADGYVAYMESLSSAAALTSASIHDINVVLRPHAILAETAASMDAALAESLDALKTSADLGGSELDDIDEYMKDFIKSMGDANPALEQWAENQVTELKKVHGAFEDFDKQVSTVFTNFAQGIAENIVEWKGWKDTCLDVVDDFAKLALGSLMETLFDPLNDLIKKGAKSLGDWLTSSVGGLLGLGKGAAGGATGGAAGTAAGAGGAAGTAAGAGGAGAAGGAGGGAGGGAMGVGEFGAGGATGGGAGGGTAGAIGSVAPFVPLAIAVGIGIADWASGLTTSQALYREANRDLGVNLMPLQIAEFLQSRGISEDAAWSHRVEIEQSPAFLEWILETMGQRPHTTWDAFKGPLAWGAVKDMWAPYNSVYSDWLADSSWSDWKKLLSPNALDPIKELGVNPWDAENIPQYRTGTAFVPDDGLAYLHKGEAVIPAGQGAGGITINIGVVYGLDDLDMKLAESLGRLGNRGFAFGMPG